MQLEQGTQVKIYLKNELMVEGFVYSWNNNECVLENGRGGLLVINNPSENIIMTHIMINSEPKKYAKRPRPEPEQEEESIEERGNYALPDFTKRGPFVRSTAKNR